MTMRIDQQDRAVNGYCKIPYERTLEFSGVGIIKRSAVAGRLVFVVLKGDAILQV